MKIYFFYRYKTYSSKTEPADTDSVKVNSLASYRVSSPNTDAYDLVLANKTPQQEAKILR